MIKNCIIKILERTNAKNMVTQTYKSMALWFCLTYRDLVDGFLHAGMNFSFQNTRKICKALYMTGSETVFSSSFRFLLSSEKRNKGSYRKYRHLTLQSNQGRFVYNQEIGYHGTVTSALYHSINLSSKVVMFKYCGFTENPILFALEQTSSFHFLGLSGK